MLNRKLWRDLWYNKTQFLSIFLMAFLGLLVFVGLDAESHGIEKSGDTFYEAYNLADFWIKGCYFTKDDANKIMEIDGVNQAERRLHIEGKAEHLHGTDSNAQTAEEDNEPYMQLEFLDTQNISQMKVLSGEPFQEDREGVWLDDKFATYQKLTVGDTLTIKVNNTEITEPIRGTIIHPEYVYYTSESEEMVPSYGTFGCAFLSGKEFPGAGNIYTEILVDTDADKNQEQIKEKIKEIMDNPDIIIMDRTQMLSFSTFDAEIEQHKMMTFMFPMIFLLIAVLGIITTMTRMTANQRIQIGTLKALGFSRGRITRHYMSYGFWISTLGALLGAVTGYYTLPALLRQSMQTTYVLPVWYVAISRNSYYAVIIEVAVSTWVSFMACRKELREVPAETLKPKPPKNMKHSALEKSKMWLRMSFQTQWNIRDIIRNKARTSMGIVGVAGCTMLLLCAFGCYDAFQAFPAWLYEDLMTAKATIVLSDSCKQGDAEEYAKKYKGQMIEEEAIELTANGKAKTGTLTTVDDGNLMHFQNPDIKEIELNQEGIMMSAKMASVLGVKAGDFVKWHVMGDDTWQNTRITQLNRVPSSQGITISREQQKKLNYDFRATKILTNHSVPADISDDLQVQTLSDATQLKQEMVDSMKVMNLMVVILVIAAAVMGIVVLHNLGVLSFIEKTREIATLKVLGFRTRKIRGILQMQNIWVTTFGILVGLPLGYGFLLMLCNSVSDSMDIVPVITPYSYALAIAGTYAVSILVNMMLSGKVKTIDMVDALKGTE